MKKAIISGLILVLSLSNAVINAPVFSDDNKGIMVDKKNKFSENRTALVIGQSDYKKVSKLTNTANDAKDIANALKSLGFKVIEKTNVNREDMMSAIDHFRDELISRKGVGLFYYSGHGLQVNGENYLVPTDADIKSESQVAFRAVNAGEVLSTMQDAKANVNIVILDACRDNPFKGFSRSSSVKGLTVMNAPKGTILAYATAPGSVASDGGTKKNGLYTEKLLKYLKVKDMKIEDVFKNVRNEMVAETGGKQLPWESSSLIGDFYFNPGGKLISKPQVINAEPLVVEEKDDEFDKYDQILADEEKKENEKLAKLEKAEIIFNKLKTLDNSTSLSKEAKQKMWEEYISDFNYPENKNLETAKGKIASYKGITENLILVQGGRFQMGSSDYEADSDEKPVHSVTVDSFYIGKYEVKLSEYREFISDTGRSMSGGCWYWTGSKWENDSSKNYNNPGFTQSVNHPVTCVSWEDSVAYCNWKSKKEGLPSAYDSNGDLVNKRGYRLPTEAEWEFASRGGNSSRGYKYSGSDNPGAVAWYSDNSGSKTHEVGSRQANELGIHDLSGNVWEWVSDWYDESYYSKSPANNPYNSVSGSLRVIRGGSWYDLARDVRVASRGGSSPDNRGSHLGFRLSRTAP